MTEAGTAPPIASLAIKLWLAHNKDGTWPRAGAWLDQPLEYLAAFDVLDMVAQTKRYMRRKDADWKKLSRLQRELIAWIES